MAQVQQQNLCETCVREEKGEVVLCVYREGDKKWCYAPWDADDAKRERRKEDLKPRSALWTTVWKKSTLRKSQLIMPPKASQKCFVDFFLEYQEGRNLKYTHIRQKLTSINWPPFFLEYRHIFSTNNNFGMKTTELFWPLCIRLKNKRIFLPPPLWFCHWLLISWVNTKVHPRQKPFWKIARFNHNYYFSMETAEFARLRKKILCLKKLFFTWLFWMVSIVGVKVPHFGIILRGGLRVWQRGVISSSWWMNVLWDFITFGRYVLCVCGGADLWIIKKPEKIVYT